MFSSLFCTLFSFLQVTDVHMRLFLASPYLKYWTHTRSREA